jgi:hypothetical protein
MKNEAVGFTDLPSHPLPKTLTQAATAYGRQLCDALMTLEANLASCHHDKTLLLLDRAALEDLAIIEIERLLRYIPCQHLLVLVSPQAKAKLMARWKKAISVDGHKLSEQFSLTTMPQNAQDAQLCIASVFDIQMQVDVASTHHFFKSFDAVMIYGVPSSPGPAWSQIVDLFASNTCVIGLSATLTEEEGALFFGNVIDTKKASPYKLKRA